MTIVSEIKPEGFSPKMACAACYLVHGGKLLLLQQANGRREEGCWGVPGGSIEEMELPRFAAAREVQEETGIILPAESLVSLGYLYIQKPTIEFLYYLFHYELTQQPKVILSDEHTDYRWEEFTHLFSLSLRAGAIEALSAYHKRIREKLSSEI